MKNQTGWTTYHASKWHEMYLDWVNNFLTVERFAEYYNMTQEHAEEIIRVGRIYNNNRSYIREDIATLIEVLGYAIENPDMDNLDAVDFLSNLKEALEGSK